MLHFNVLPRHLERDYATTFDDLPPAVSDAMRYLTEGKVWSKVNSLLLVEPNGNFWLSEVSSLRCTKRVSILGEDWRLVNSNLWEGVRYTYLI